MTYPTTPAEWLASLPAWDGIPRVDSWLSQYLGAPATLREQMIGRSFLIGMIARALHPGCKFDYCLVLQGKQGSGKTSSLQALAGEWFCDHDFDLYDRDSLAALQGHWLFEITALGALIAAEKHQQKSFLSRQYDTCRPAYDSKPAVTPRACVFVACTGDAEPIKGNRRFWPILCGARLDPAGLHAARRQLFAEALELYKSGVRYWLTPEESDRLIEQKPASFKDRLAEWVSKQSAPFSMADAATQGLGLAPEELTPAVVTRVGIALRKLGCVSEIHRIDDTSQRVWFTPGEARCSDFADESTSSSTSSPSPLEPAVRPVMTDGCDALRQERSQAPQASASYQAAPQSQQRSS